ncbi:MAG: RebB family R body protein [Methylococcaceae bacterium]|jgi:hypothetical protein
MAFPTAVNDQITDSVTQSNVEVLASASATAIGSLYQIYANSLALAVQNATTNQQNANAINQAVTTSCVNLLLGNNKTQ